jgi:hypothetical protein
MHACTSPQPVGWMMKLEDLPLTYCRTAACRHRTLCDLALYGTLRHHRFWCGNIELVGRTIDLVEPWSTTETSLVPSCLAAATVSGVAPRNSSAGSRKAARVGRWPEGLAAMRR